MSDVENKKKVVRRQRSIHAVHYNIKRRDEMTARPLAKLTGSPEVTAYRQQVAGHRSVDDSNYLGLLQCSNGTILKPIVKEEHRREVEFYERVRAAQAGAEPDLAELRRLVPRYSGTTRYVYGDVAREYLVLEDLALRMLEPCIMDVKIGRRTWDPLASEEKIKREQSKYALCKQQFAFCIPGYQYQVHGPGARRARYGKEHGKRLHGQAVPDAIRSYLSGGSGVLCRALVLQLLTELWRVQTWSRHQTTLTLYSASLLITYDAARLADCCGHHRSPRPLGASPSPPPAPRPRSKSLTAATSPSAASFSGQLSAKGPLYKKVSPVPLSPMSLAQGAFPPGGVGGGGGRRGLASLCHNHSLEHNYEDELSKIRAAYRAGLAELSSEAPRRSPGAAVKIIDFAHAFFNEDDERRADDNFNEGIDSLVRIFEGFLTETDAHPL